MRKLKQESEWILGCERSLRLMCRCTMDLCCCLFFAVEVNVIAELASELLYANDLVLMSETIKGLWHKFLKFKDVFESKGLKVNLGKSKVMASSGITNGRPI